MKDIQDLKDTIQAVLSTSTMKTNRDKVIRGLKGRINRTKITNIMLDNINVAFLDDMECYYIAKFLYNMNDKEVEIKTKLKNDLDITKYFTKGQMDEYNLIPIKVESEIQDYIFTDVSQVKDDMWCVAKITIQELDKLFKNGFIRYDKDQQREMDVVVKDGVEIKKAKIYKKSIKSIASKMLAGEFHPNTITLNVAELEDGSEKYYYDEENRTFSIYSDNPVFIIDGAHRCLGGFLALTENPDLNQVLLVSIMHVDVQKAQSFIYQENLKNSINPKLLSTYNHSNIYATLANEINNYGNSNNNLLFNKLASTDADMRGKLLLSYNFIDALESTFKIQTGDMSEVRKLKKYLVEFFNELFSILKSDYQNSIESLKFRDTLSMSAFYFYLGIASQLYEVEDWQDELVILIGKVNFDKEYGTFKHIDMRGKIKNKPTPKTKKEIQELLSKLRG